MRKNRKHHRRTVSVFTRMKIIKWDNVQKAARGVSMRINVKTGQIKGKSTGWRGGDHIGQQCTRSDKQAGYESIIHCTWGEKNICTTLS